MDISVIVPLYNEEESLPELNEWIARVGFDKKGKVIHSEGFVDYVDWIVKRKKKILECLK